MFEEQEIYRVCPERVRQALHRLTPAQRECIEEIRLRCGYAVTVVQNGTESPLFDGVQSIIVTPGMLAQLLAKATDYSTYASAEYLRQGFVTIAGGHRIGFCGQAVMEHGALKTIRSLSSASIRVAKQLDVYRRKLEQLFDKLPGSVLIIGQPGVGKTSLLRELTRMLSDRYRQRVCLIDERFEIAACRDGVSTFQVGAHTDILSGCPKAEAMELILRTMSPQWIVVDEITTANDVLAMRRVGNCGVLLAATAHAADLQQMRSRQLYRTLFESGIFETVLRLTPERKITKAAAPC